MSDQRFTARVKRIEKRAKTRPTAELIAGVGPVKDARAAATPHSPPVLLLPLAAASGFAALFHLRGHTDPATIRALIDTPQDAIAFAQANPTLAAAALWLTLIGLVFVFALLFRALGPKARTFGFAGSAGVIAEQAYRIADPVALQALVTSYLPLG